MGPAPARPAGIPQLTVVFLGTGARWPTPERGVAAAVVARGADHVLIDCGEGTQRQMMLSRPGLRRLRAVLVTHCHADHVLGLPGLLATLSETRRGDLPILGPPGLGALVEGFLSQVGPLSFGLDVRETAPGEGVACDGYRIEAVEARHDCPALGWTIAEDPLRGHLDPGALAARGVGPGPDRARLAGGEALEAVAPGEVTGPARRGRRIVYSGDTRPAPGVAAAAAGADLLVHEATFLEADRDLADRAGHSTAAQAAALAARAGVGLLALTHRSTRYPREEVLAEARGVFPAAVAPADLDAIEVPLPERGPPFLIPEGGRAGP